MANHSPMLHVLMADGRVAEFNRKAMVILDTTNNEDDEANGNSTH